MAMLHGLRPVSVAHCRVLEIGCNTGANLIPMAYAIPGSDFTGFDLAGAPIAAGQARVRELGLTNIRLLQADLMQTEDKPELQGKFDYIIAHGVYAWVPPPVREGLLNFLRDHLSDNGIVFLSFATLPGGHMLMMAREILSYRGIDTENSVASVRQAVEFLRFVATSRPEGDGYRVLLERQLENMERRSAEVVFHDELAGAYQPVAFSQFAKHTAQHGLSYFSDSEILPAKDPSYQAETATAVQKMAGGNPLMREQILDFIRMRQYREALLCGAERAFTYDVDLNAFRRLHMTSAARSSAGAETGTRAYTMASGLHIETQHPAAIAVMECLIARHPEAVPCTELIAMLERQNEPVDDQFLVMMLRLTAARVVRPTAWPAPVTRVVSERPLASLVCRQDIQRSTRIISLQHTVLEMPDPIVRKLIPLLDGTRDRADILRDLTQALPEVPAQTLAEGLEPALELLGKMGVLESSPTR